MLTEVELGSGFKAVHSTAQINLIAVEGEDLFFGEGAFDLNGQIGFLDFARRGAFGGEKQVARQLHGERGRALSAAVTADVVPRRPSHAEDIDTPVRREAFVFNGDDGLAQHRRKVFVVDHLAPLQRKRTDDASLAVVEISGGGRAVALEVVNLRQIDGIDQHEPGQRARNHSQEEQRGKGVLAGELTPPMRVRGLGV